MKRLTASLLATSLLVAGSAAAQSSSPYPSQHDAYGNEANGYGHQGATYDYARVVRVDPVIGSGYGRNVSDQDRCHESQSDDVYVGNERSYGNERGYGDDGYYDNDGYGGRDDSYARGNEGTRTMATVIGGIAGAVLGSKIGEGSGRYVGTAVGSMVGGMAGRSIYDSSVRNRQYERRGTVRVCDPVPVSRRNGAYGQDAYADQTLDGYDVTYEYANRTYHTRTNYHPGDRIRVRVDVQAE